MKKMRFEKNITLAELHDELLTSVAALRSKPVPSRPGRLAPFEAVIALEGMDGPDGWAELTVPDEVPDAAVNAVVTAHKAKKS